MKKGSELNSSSRVVAPREESQLRKTGLQLRTMAEAVAAVRVLQGLTVLGQVSKTGCGRVVVRTTIVTLGQRNGGCPNQTKETGIRGD